MGGLARFIVLTLLLTPAGLASADSGDRVQSATDTSSCLTIETASSSATGVSTSTGSSASVSVAGGGSKASVVVGAAACQKQPEKSAEAVQEIVDLAVWIVITTARANGAPV